MKRRSFVGVLGAAMAGIVAGARASATDGPPAEKPADVHACRGRNACKGKGGCHLQQGCGKNGCVGLNECKGRGRCASTAARHECAGKNGCKGLGGCKSGAAGCAAKNTCKGKGGCAVPLKSADCPVTRWDREKKNKAPE